MQTLSSKGIHSNPINYLIDIDYSEQIQRDLKLNNLMPQYNLNQENR